MTGGIIANGPYDIVLFAMDLWLKQMKEDLIAQNDQIGMNTGDKIKAGVKTRLMLMSPYIDKWPQAMALGLHPSNLISTTKHLNDISDEIWYLSGDKSTEAMDWYTKRAHLTRIYVLTEAYMI